MAAITPPIVNLRPMIARKKSNVASKSAQSADQHNNTVDPVITFEQGIVKFFKSFRLSDLPEERVSLTSSPAMNSPLVKKQNQSDFFR